MKYHVKGNSKNVISDKDINLSELSRGIGTDIGSVLAQHDTEIQQLKANVKWLYKYGGVGGGNQGGTSSGSSTSSSGLSAKFTLYSVSSDGVEQSTILNSKSSTAISCSPGSVQLQINITSNYVDISRVALTVTDKEGNIIVNTQTFDPLKTGGLKQVQFYVSGNNQYIAQLTTGANTITRNFQMFTNDSSIHVYLQDKSSNVKTEAGTEFSYKTAQLCVDLYSYLPGASEANQYCITSVTGTYFGNTQFTETAAAISQGISEWSDKVFDGEQKYKPYVFDIEEWIHPKDAQNKYLSESATYGIWEVSIKYMIGTISKEYTARFLHKNADNIFTYAYHLEGALTPSENQTNVQYTSQKQIPLNIEVYPSLSEINNTFSLNIYTGDDKNNLTQYGDTIYVAGQTLYTIYIRNPFEPSASEKKEHKTLCISFNINAQSTFYYLYIEQPVPDSFILNDTQWRTQILTTSDISDSNGFAAFFPPAKAGSDEFTSENKSTQIKFREIATNKYLNPSENTVIDITSADAFLKTRNMQFGAYKYASPDLQPDSSAINVINYKSDNTETISCANDSSQKDFILSFYIKYNSDIVQKICTLYPNDRASAEYISIYQNYIELCGNTKYNVEKFIIPNDGEYHLVQFIVKSIYSNNSTLPDGSAYSSTPAYIICIDGIFETAPTAPAEINIFPYVTIQDGEVKNAPAIVWERGPFTFKHISYAYTNPWINNKNIIPNIPLSARKYLLDFDPLFPAIYYNQVRALIDGRGDTIDTTYFTNLYSNLYDKDINNTEHGVCYYKGTEKFISMNYDMLKNIPAFTSMPIFVVIPQALDESNLPSDLINNLGAADTDSHLHHILQCSKRKYGESTNLYKYKCKMYRLEYQDGDYSLDALIPDTETFKVNSYSPSHINEYISFQGSSTLLYDAKNYEWSVDYYDDKLDNNGQAQPTVYVNPFCSSEEEDESASAKFSFKFPESSFNIKTDLVDSSHCNNTVTGAFVNDIMSSPFNSLDTTYETCLRGTPVLFFIANNISIVKTEQTEQTEQVTAEDFSKYDYVFMGIHNFNLNRSSVNNLGYQYIDNLEERYLLPSANNDRCKIYIVPSGSSDVRIRKSFYVAEVQGNSNLYDYSQYDLGLVDRMLGDYYWSDPNASKISTVATPQIFLNAFKGLNYYVKNNIIGQQNSSQSINQNIFTVSDYYVTTAGLLANKESIEELKGNSKTIYCYDGSDKIVKINELVDDASAIYALYTDFAANYPAYESYDRAYYVDETQYNTKITETSAGNTWVNESPRVTNPFHQVHILYTENNMAYSPILSSSGNIPYVLFTSGKNDSTPNDWNKNQWDYKNELQYYMICMAFGLVDSVQKNRNIKCPEYKTNDESGVNIWYSAFYDMDTGYGRTNAGGNANFKAFSDGIHGNKIIQDCLVYDSTGTAPTDWFDATSSYLTMFAKYATIFDDSLRENIIADTNGSNWSCPYNAWAYLRTSSLSTAKGFYEKYIKDYFGTTDPVIWNLNYMYKYFSYSSTKYYGTDNSSDSAEITDTAISKFNGNQKYQKIQWLKRRWKFLDAMFGFNNNTRRIHNSNYSIVTGFEGKLKDYSTNMDITIAQTAFPHFIKGNNQKNINITVTADVNTPLIMQTAASEYQLFITDDEGKASISINGLTNTDVGFYGSYECTSFSEVGQFCVYSSSSSSNTVSSSIKNNKVKELYFNTTGMSDVTLNLDELTSVERIIFGPKATGSSLTVSASSSSISLDEIIFYNCTINTITIKGIGDNKLILNKLAIYGLKCNTFNLEMATINNISNTISSGNKSNYSDSTLTASSYSDTTLNLIGSISSENTVNYIQNIKNLSISNINFGSTSENVNVNIYNNASLNTLTLKNIQQNNIVLNINCNTIQTITHQDLKLKTFTLCNLAYLQDFSNSSMDVTNFIMYHSTSSYITQGITSGYYGQTSANQFKTLTLSFIRESNQDIYLRIYNLQQLTELNIVKRGSNNTDGKYKTILSGAGLSGNGNLTKITVDYNGTPLDMTKNAPSGENADYQRFYIYNTSNSTCGFCGLTSASDALRKNVCLSSRLFAKTTSIRSIFAAIYRRDRNNAFTIDEIKTWLDNNKNVLKASVTDIAGAFFGAIGAPATANDKYKFAYSKDTTEYTYSDVEKVYNNVEGLFTTLAGYFTPSKLQYTGGFLGGCGINIIVPALVKNFAKHKGTTAWCSPICVENDETLVDVSVDGGAYSLSNECTWINFNYRYPTPDEDSGVKNNNAFCARFNRIALLKLNTSVKTAVIESAPTVDMIAGSSCETLHHLHFVTKEGEIVPDFNNGIPSTIKKFSIDSEFTSPIQYYTNIERIFFQDTATNGVEVARSFMAPINVAVLDNSGNLPDEKYCVDIYTLLHCGKAYNASKPNEGHFVQYRGYSEINDSNSIYYYNDQNDYDKQYRSLLFAKKCTNAEEIKLIFENYNSLAYKFSYCNFELKDTASILDNILHDSNKSCLLYTFYYADFTGKRGNSAVDLTNLYGAVERVLNKDSEYEYRDITNYTWDENQEQYIANNDSADKCDYDDLPKLPRSAPNLHHTFYGAKGIKVPTKRWCISDEILDQAYYAFYNAKFNYKDTAFDNQEDTYEYSATLPSSGGTSATQPSFLKNPYTQNKEKLDALLMLPPDFFKVFKKEAKINGMFGHGTFSSDISQHLRGYIPEAEETWFINNAANAMSTDYLFKNAFVFPYPIKYVKDYGVQPDNSVYTISVEEREDSDSTKYVGTFAASKCFSLFPEWWCNLTRNIYRFSTLLPLVEYLALFNTNDTVTVSATLPQLATGGEFYTCTNLGTNYKNVRKFIEKFKKDNAGTIQRLFTVSFYPSDDVSLYENNDITYIKCDKQQINYIRPTTVTKANYIFGDYLPYFLSVNTTVTTTWSTDEYKILPYSDNDDYKDYWPYDLYNSEEGFDPKYYTATAN